MFCHHWSDEKWKSSMIGGGRHKKRFQYCADSSGTILYLRALQGHSGRNLIDPSLQDNVVIPDGFFKYIYHVGCAINLHLIINSGLIPGGQNLSHQTDSILSVLWILWIKNTKILTRSTWEHRVLHSTCTKHGRNITIRCIGATSHLLKRKDWKFYQTRSNTVIILHEKHSQLVVFRKLFGWKLEKSFTRKYMRHLDFFQTFP